MILDSLESKAFKLLANVPIIQLIIYLYLLFLVIYRVVRFNMRTFGFVSIYIYIYVVLFFRYMRIPDKCIVAA